MKLLHFTKKSMSKLMETSMSKPVQSQSIFSKTGISFALISSLLFTPFVVADNISVTQQKQLTEITDLLRKNPQLIQGLQVNLTQYIAGQSNISQTLKQNHDYLYNNPMQPYMGAENPKLTIINFTDYNCPYCKRLESGLVNVLKKYPQIRVVNVLLPFQQRLVPGMKTNTAWYALNVWENNRSSFAEVHRLMMAKPSRHDSQSIMKIAELTSTDDALSVDETKKKMVEKNEKIFTALGLRGTPSLIIGDEITPGFISEAQLEQKITTQLKLLEEK